MARPISPEKRGAILAAATELIASHGVGISTAAIAKAAGVAEGTLFTYFATKDELLNQLYLELSRDLVQALLADYLRSGTPRDRISHILGKLIDWGVKNRVRHKAKLQLRTSDRISAKTHRRAQALFDEPRSMVEESLTGRIRPELSSFYIESVLPGLAEITIEAIFVKPKDHERLTQACFELFWKGIAS